jgi:hypothetical protein
MKKGSEIELVQKFIEAMGGLSHEYSQKSWRFLTKAKLCGQIQTPERFLRSIIDPNIDTAEFRPIDGPLKLDEKEATKLIADAKQGDANADQVLREVAAEYLKRRILPPKQLADYAAACLQQPKARPHKTKTQSHKTEFRDWVLAVLVGNVVRKFGLKPTRNRASERDCACSIVAKAAKVSENTVQNAWNKYKSIFEAPHRVALESASTAPHVSRHA